MEAQANHFFGVNYLVCQRFPRTQLKNVRFGGKVNPALCYWFQIPITSLNITLYGFIHIS